MHNAEVREGSPMTQPPAIVYRLINWILRVLDLVAPEYCACSEKMVDGVCPLSDYQRGL